MAITAVIPVRKGSRRIKDKNIRPFAGSSLLQIKIRQLKQISNIDQIIVSTDSNEMMDIAKDEGVIGKWRPKEYCDEKTKSFREVVEYIATEDVDTENLIWIPCVCPLVKIESIKRALDLYKDIESGKIDKDSIASAILLKEYIFNENGPANFSPKNHVPSQQLPNWHMIVNGFFISGTEKMKKWKFVYGPNPYLYELNKNEGIDIDVMDDFEMAEVLYVRRMKKRL